MNRFVASNLQRKEYDYGTDKQEYMSPQLYLSAYQSVSSRGISPDSEGFPVIDYDLCIKCDKCVRKCPLKAMKQIIILIKTVLSAKDGIVDNHLGHYEYFTVCMVSEATSVHCSTACGCKSGVAATLYNMGIEVMLAGNMGNDASRKFEEQGIKVIRGCAQVR